MKTSIAITFEQGACRRLAVFLVLVLMTVPTLSWAQCNPFMLISQTPTVPPNYNLGDTVRVSVQFGAGTLLPGNEPMSVDELRFALDCTATDPVSRVECLGILGDPANQDDGDAITYAGGLSVSSVGGDACDALDIVANSAGTPGMPAADPNLMLFSDSGGSPILFQSLETCLVEFDVVINSLGNNIEPTTNQLIEGAGAYQGTCPVGSADASPSLSYPVDINPDIDIEKLVFDPAAGMFVDADNPPGPYHPVGGVVSYQLEVCNTGDVDLDPVMVEDANLGIPPTNIGFLAAGDCTTLDSGTIAGLDSSTACASPGPFMNTAIATGTPPVGPDVTDNDPANVFCSDPSIDIEKLVFDPATGMFVDADNPPGPIHLVGSVVSYQLEVCNTGNVDLDPVMIEDANLNIPPTNIGSLAAGACTTLDSGTIAGLDSSTACASPGPFLNTAFATGTPPVGQDVTDNDPANVDCGVPDISILKEISIDDGITWFDANDPGSAPVAVWPSGALYRLTVENTGAITLENVVVNDPTLGIMDYSVGTLTPGQVVVLTQAEIPALSVPERCGQSGDYGNIADVSGAPVGAGPVTDEDPAFLVCVGEPDIEILKEIFDEELGMFVDANSEATAPVVIAPSGALYRLTVTNTGTAPLDNVVVNDPTLGVMDFAVGPMAPGQVVVLTQVEIPALSVVERCSETGTFTNTADVAGTSTETGEVVTDSDPAVLVCEEEPVQFRVVKDFSDDNPAGVEVFLECNTGLPLQQQAVVHDPEAAGLQPGDFTVILFIVRDFEPGAMDCDIWEAIPEGYDPEYTAGATTGIADDIFDDDDGCHYEGVESGEFTCSVFNDLEPVEVIVEKIWIDERPEFQGSTFVDVTLECDGPIVGGYSCLNGDGNGNGNYCRQKYIDPNNPGEFLVWPHFEGTFCFATEVPIVGVLTDESDCEEMIVFPGQGDRCVIINTRLYAGIPTLNQYGLMLLALLMLGVGFIAFRRFA